MDFELLDRFRSTAGEVACGVIGDGPDVVLVHGTPTSSLIWKQVVGELSDRFRFHFLDLPGYGKSSKSPGQDVRLRSLAGVVAEWIESRRFDNDPILVGHDFGAAAVLGAHLFEGVPVAGICVADGVVLSPWGTPFSRHVKENESVFAAVPDYVHEAILRAHLDSAFVQSPSPEVMSALVEPWLGPDGKDAYYRQVGQYDYEYTEKLADRYQRLEVPVLILWGDRDPWIDITIGRQFQSMIAGAELQPIHGAGHFAMLETPIAFAKSLESWLERQTA